MKIEIYTVDYCPYCKKAVAFLDEKGVEYTRIRIDEDEEGWFEKLAVRLNKNAADLTVPQIFIDDKSIGGYTDMMALYEVGKLLL